MRRFIDEWLAALDAVGGEATTEWTGGGVRIRFRAKPRSPDTRGWAEMPSLNMLEQQMADLHFVDGRRRQLHTLTLDELRGWRFGRRRHLSRSVSDSAPSSSISSRALGGANNAGSSVPSGLESTRGAAGSRRR